MSNNAGDTPPPPDDAALESRLHDYSDRWRTAIALAETRSEHGGETLRLKPAPAPGGHRHTLIALAAAAAVVVLLLGTAFAISSVRSGGTPLPSGTSAATPSPSAAPVVPCTAGSWGGGSQTTAGPNNTWIQYFEFNSGADVPCAMAAAPTVILSSPPTSTIKPCPANDSAGTVCFPTGPPIEVPALGTVALSYTLAEVDCGNPGALSIGEVAASTKVALPRVGPKPSADAFRFPNTDENGTVTVRFNSISHEMSLQQICVRVTDAQSFRLGVRNGISVDGPTFMPACAVERQKASTFGGHLNDDGTWSQTFTIANESAASCAVGAAPEVRIGPADAIIIKPCAEGQTEPVCFPETYVQEVASGDAVTMSYTFAPIACDQPGAVNPAELKGKGTLTLDRTDGAVTVKIPLSGILNSPPDDSPLYRGELTCVHVTKAEGFTKQSVLTENPVQVTTSTTAASTSAPANSGTGRAYFSTRSSGGVTAWIASVATISEPTTVTVNVTGFHAAAPVSIAVCPANRDITGPGDCGRAANSNAKLITAGPDGTATAQLTIPVGALGNATAPQATCDATHPCVVHVLDVSDSSTFASVPIPY